MPRPAVVCALSRDETESVASELASAGLEVLPVQTGEQLEDVLSSRRDVGLAILDGEWNFDGAVELHAILDQAGRRIPSLILVSPRTLEQLEERDGALQNTEFFTRPFSLESLRWRVEAMLIRSETYDDGSGTILQSRSGTVADWGRRAIVVAVFSPKGGVGKTTIAVNLATALQTRKKQRVLLVDADVVTGHIATSLGLDRVESVADVWDGGGADDLEATGLATLAAAQPNGLSVLVVTNSPLWAGQVDPARLSEGLMATRIDFDVVVIDLHPDYGVLNQAILDRCDRILVPVTPDVPAIRAAMQFVELSHDLGLRDRLAMVVNRANSGVSVADMEKTTGMKAFGQIRSGGLLFVRAANEGATVVETFPREKVTGDFEALADALVKREPVGDKNLLKILNRPRAVARA